jgi:hypothetical protein
MKKNIEFYVIYFKFSKINFSFMCALWMEICMMKLNTYSPILLKKIIKYCCALVKNHKGPPIK